MRVAFVTFEYPPFIIDSAGICSSHIDEEFANLSHQIVAIAYALIKRGR